MDSIVKGRNAFIDAYLVEGKRFAELSERSTGDDYLYPVFREAQVSKLVDEAQEGIKAVRRLEHAMAEGVVDLTDYEIDVAEATAELVIMNKDLQELFNATDQVLQRRKAHEIKKQNFIVIVGSIIALLGLLLVVK